MSCTCPETNWMDGKGHDLGCPLANEQPQTREAGEREGALRARLELWLQDHEPTVEDLIQLLRTAGQPEQGREALREHFLKLAEALHIISNGSGLPKRYKECYLHGFETCTSPECVQARKLAALAAAPSGASTGGSDGLREALESIQWGACDGIDAVCPACDRSAKQGHSETCKVGAALSRPGGAR